MTDQTETMERRRAVVDLSVYNAVSVVARRDMTVAECVMLLRVGWAPHWAPVEEVITAESVAAARDRLVARGLLRAGSEALVVPLRQPDGSGVPLVMTEDRRDYRVAH